MVSPQCHSLGLGRAVVPTHPPGLVMALASSAHSAPGLGAFGGFESQSAELFLRIKQREKAALGRGQETGKNRLHSATAVLPSCSENRGVSTVCKLLGQVPATRRTGHLSAWTCHQGMMQSPRSAARVSCQHQLQSLEALPEGAGTVGSLPTPAPNHQTPPSTTVPPHAQSPSRLTHLSHTLLQHS